MRGSDSFKIIFDDPHVAQKRLGAVVIPPLSILTPICQASEIVALYLNRNRRGLEFRIRLIK
jgi:hypothetical protein